MTEKATGTGMSENITCEELDSMPRKLRVRQCKRGQKQKSCCES